MRASGEEVGLQGSGEEARVRDSGQECRSEATARRWPEDGGSPLPSDATTIKNTIDCIWEQGMKDKDYVIFQPPPTRLTGESWSVTFHCMEAPKDKNTIELDMDLAHITPANLASIKAKLGYCGRHYTYYEKRCGLATASLVAIDSEQEIEAMIQSSKEERKVRLRLSKDEQRQLQVSITPMKRPRVSTIIDESTTQEPIDAYKKWLAELQEEEPHTEFKDDYREETIKTYKEWLRRQDSLSTILSYIDNQNYDAEETRETDWPSHARRPKNKGNDSSKGSKKHGRGTLKGYSAAIKRIKSGSQKLEIEFLTKRGGPVSRHGRSFVDEVVMFTRMRAPLIGVTKWKEIHERVKNSIASDILSRWDLHDIDNEEAKEKIWTIAKERYKAWRSTLSSTYKAYTSYAARMKHKPGDVDIVEWHYLMQYFGTEKFKKASSRNSENRKKQKTMQSWVPNHFPKSAMSSRYN